MQKDGAIYSDEEVEKIRRLLEKFANLEYELFTLKKIKS